MSPANQPERRQAKPAAQRPKAKQASTKKPEGAATAATGQSVQHEPVPGLEGALIKGKAVVAFDGEWQYPAVTEQHAFRRAQEALKPRPGAVYIGFPWATLIDHLNQGNPKVNGLLSALDAITKACEGRQRRITVCQQVYLAKHNWILKRAGITDIFWPHTTADNNLAGIRLHPFPLYPVQWQRPGPDNPERSILFSFIGARAKPHYLTKNRNLIISELAHCSDALIIGNDNWFYDDLVYGVQISGSIKPSDPRAQGTGPEHLRQLYIDSLKRSIFCLCPSGTGPNTIRLWEAIGSGAIPVVLSDSWVPPGPRQLWDEAVFILRDTPTGVRNIPERCRTWASKPALLERRRAALAKLWQRYRPGTFITDLEAFWGSPSN